MGKRTKNTFGSTLNVVDASCPECGKNTIRHTPQAVYDLGYDFVIECTSCGFSISSFSIVDAFERWQSAKKETVS